jgi:hypothetical protein
MATDMMDGEALFLKAVIYLTQKYMARIGGRLQMSASVGDGGDE